MDKVKLKEMLGKLFSSEEGSPAFAETKAWFREEANWDGALAVQDEIIKAPELSKEEFELLQDISKMTNLVGSPYQPDTPDALEAINEIFDQLEELDNIADPDAREARLNEILNPSEE